VPTVDLIDETYIVADADVLARAVHDQERWRRWWPDLRLTVFMDRGPAGVRWSVTGDLVGSAEIWLEPFGDGVVLHLYLRLDPAQGAAGVPKALRPRAADRVRRRYALAWKVHANALKDELEGGRPPGEGQA
jgi:hypothetical protein